MEWAQEVEALLPDHYVKVLIAENVRGERVVTLK